MSWLSAVLANRPLDSSSYLDGLNVRPVPAGKSFPRGAGTASPRLSFDEWIAADTDRTFAEWAFGEDPAPKPLPKLTWWQKFVAAVVVVWVGLYWSRR